MTNISVPREVLQAAVDALTKSVNFANAIGIQNWSTVAVDCHDSRKSIRALLDAPRVEQCTWEQQDDEHMPGTYASSCGELWSFIDGGPADNHVRFCQGCGKQVEVKENT